MSAARRVALWEAINAYVRACGGDPSARTVGVARMNAVIAVERAAMAEEDDIRGALAKAEALLAALAEAMPRCEQLANGTRCRELATWAPDVMPDSGVCCETHVPTDAECEAGMLSPRRLRYADALEAALAALGRKESP
jgi:hypothetical protein